MIYVARKPTTPERLAVIETELKHLNKEMDEFKSDAQERLKGIEEAVGTIKANQDQAIGAVRLAKSGIVGGILGLVSLLINIASRFK